MGHQAEDGKVHLAYFNADANVSFVWNGTNKNMIDVCPGGYGEPVRGYIISGNNYSVMTVENAFKYFKEECDNFLANFYNKS